jgi:response regulator of citrate/malate metabolism
MDKISKAQLIEALSHVPPTLKKLASERDAAREELAQLKMRIECEKTAAQMIQKGLTNDPFEKVVDYVEKQAEEVGLAAVRKGIEFSGPDMGDKLAHLANEEPVAVADDASDFVRCILGGLG